MQFYHAIDLLRGELSEDIFHELIYLYLSDLKKNLDLLENALSKQDYASISLALQCFKEVSFSLGIIDLHQETLRLEEYCAFQNFKSLSDAFVQFKEKTILVLKDFSKEQNL